MENRLVIVPPSKPRRTSPSFPQTFFTLFCATLLAACAQREYADTGVDKERISQADLCEIDGEPVELSGVVVWGTGDFHGEITWYAEVDGDVPQYGDKYSLNFDRSYKVLFIEGFDLVKDLAIQNSVNSVEVYGTWKGYLGEVHPECSILRGDGYEDNMLFEIHDARKVSIVG